MSKTYEIVKSGNFDVRCRAMSIFDAIKAYDISRKFSDGSPLCLLDMRLYTPRDRRSNSVYSCVWVHDWSIYERDDGSRIWVGDETLMGSGRALGYGYDHASAAAYDAFLHAGFRLLPSFHAVGMDAAKRGILAFLRERQEERGWKDHDIFLSESYA